MAYEDDKEKRVRPIEMGEITVFTQIKVHGLRKYIKACFHETPPLVVVGRLGLS